MKKLVLCLSLLFAGAAHADDLADANALFQKKAYPQALQLYTKLANNGNPEAQVQLAQMYWYGEAGAVDDAKADAWFRKAAAKGNKTAVAALEVMKQRTVRRADIDYWLSGYDGADLKSGKFRCAAPRIPAVSKINEEITAVASRVEAWQNCYNGFVQNLNEAAPLVKRIPPDVSALMNQPELEKSRVYLEEVYARIAEEAKVSAKLVLADFGAWRSATDNYVSEHNAIVKAGPSAERQQDIDARKRNYAPGK
jgi:TPR repeat protein